MSNRKKRTKKKQSHDVDLKKQRKGLVPEKIQSGILKGNAEKTVKSVNPGARAVDQQNLRRGNR